MSVGLRDSLQSLEESHRTISDQSVQNILGESRTAMVYGFASCKYWEVFLALHEHEKVSRVYNFCLGDECREIKVWEAYQRLDGEWIHQIDSGTFELRNYGSRHEKQGCARRCKTGLVNLVLENYRRVKYGDGQITPIIFCIDYEDEAGPNPYPLTSERLLSKTRFAEGHDGQYVEMNRLITHSELRRAYKLCHDPRVDTEVRQIAHNTFQFVKVKELEDTYELERLVAPWEQVDFQEELAKRKSYVSEFSPIRKKYDWRLELQRAVDEMQHIAQIM